MASSNFEPIRRPSDYDMRVGKGSRKDGKRTKHAKNRTQAIKAARRRKAAAR